MNIRELKILLDKYPDDMEIIHSRYSDWEIIEEHDFSIVKGVKKCGWVMRSHRTMSGKNKREEKEYLHLVGN